MNYLWRTLIFVLPTSTNMKLKLSLFLLTVVALFSACNRDSDPVYINYTSAIVYLQNDTVFTESSVESRALYHALMDQIKTVGSEYNRDTTVATTWGHRERAYFVNDSIEMRRYTTALHQLRSFIKDHFDEKKAATAHDGSFRVRVSLFVARDKKLAESRSIDYIFEE